MAIDASGRKWLATDGGLTMLDDGGTADAGDDVWRTFARADTFGGLPSDDVRAVAVDGDLVWVGAWQVYNHETEGWEGGGVGRLDHKGTVATADDVWAPVATFEGTLREGPQGEQVLGLVSDNVTDMALTDDGDLWVATSAHWRFEKPPVSELPPRWMRMHGGVSHLDTPARSTRRTTPGRRRTARTWSRRSPATSRRWLWTVAAGVGGDRRAGRHVLASHRGPGDRRAEPGVPTARRRFRRLRRGHRVRTAGEPGFENTVWLARRKSGLSVLDHRGTIRNKSDDIWDLDRGGPLTKEYGLATDRAQAVVVGVGDGLGRHRAPRTAWPAASARWIWRQQLSSAARYG